MKIIEAQQIYREQVKSYQAQKSAVSRQLQKVRTRMEGAPEEECDGSRAAVLELTLDKLDEKQEEYQDYLSQLAEQYCAYWNAAASEQQKDAAQEYAEDMGKIMEVARRLMRGAIVPASDEKKLMEFSMEMYQTAKNVGAMVRSQKKEKYDSLWGGKEEKEYGDPREAAENGEAAAGPEVVEAVAASGSQVVETDVAASGSQVMAAADVAAAGAQVMATAPLGV